MALRKSACSLVSTPSQRVWMPRCLAMSTISRKIIWLRELVLKFFKKIISIFKRSKSKSFKLFRLE